MNIKIISFMLMLTVFSGCAITSQQGQRKWETVSCGGFKSWDACMKQAISVCAQGFDLRNKDGNQVTQARTMDFSCR